MSTIFSSLLSVLKTLLPVFLFFVVVGSVAGFSNRLNVVQEMLLEETTVLKQLDSYYFEYDCAANNAVYIYSVDENSGDYRADLSTIITLMETELKLTTERLDEYREVISALLGGAVGGVSLKSTLKKPPGGWSWKLFKKTLLGIIGSISGYSGGYFLGSHYDTDCDSGIVVSVLKNQQSMLRIERAKLLISLLQLENLGGAQLSQTGKAINNWDKDPAFMCSSVLQSKKEKLTELVKIGIKDPNSMHFQLIDEMTAMHRKIASTGEYKVLVDLQVFKQAEQFDKYENSDSILGERVRNNREKWSQACQAVSLLSVQ